MKYIFSILLFFFVGLGAYAQSAQECFDKANAYAEAENYTEAANWLRKAADQGHAMAIYLLEMQEKGVPLDRLNEKDVFVEFWYKKATEKNDAHAQYILGRIYFEDMDYTEAVKWFRKAADQGHAEAQIELGICYTDGIAVEQDDFEAVKWFRKAAEQDNVQAQYALGECYYYGIGVTENDTEAVKWYRKAADQGHAKAQYELGLCYADGIGVEQDDFDAAKWFRKAAEQGHTTAQYDLGECYLYDFGVLGQDPSEATKWFLKAAEQDNVQAQYALGECYYYGIGVEQDYAEAVKWYSKVAELGIENAQYDLGFCYYLGLGVAQDYDEAVKWFREAAEQDHAAAQYTLAECYASGHGVTKNEAEAMNWYRKAAEQGHSEAIEALEGRQDSTTKSFTVEGVTFNMIQVEAGTFQMGSKSDQSDELPIHSVTISKDYYIGETEVTQALWEVVTGNQAFSSLRWKSDFGIGDNYPAYLISYTDVQLFIMELNQLTGKIFRMPTEAEWEYAARGGNKIGNKGKGYAYSGSKTIGDVAWYVGNSDWDTHPVATKQPNELGIYDMCGNVWEWCSDWYGPYSSSADIDPTGAASGNKRVLRGGSMHDFAPYCRTAQRGCSNPQALDCCYGFRLALSPLK